jgi:hypothetical protein
MGCVSGSARAESALFVEDEGGAEEGGGFGAIGGAAQGDGDDAVLLEEFDFAGGEVAFRADDEGHGSLDKGAAQWHGTECSGGGKDGALKGAEAGFEAIGQFERRQPQAAALLATLDGVPFPPARVARGPFRACRAVEEEPADADFGSALHEFFEDLLAVQPGHGQCHRRVRRRLSPHVFAADGHAVSAGFFDGPLNFAALAVKQSGGVAGLQTQYARRVARFEGRELDESVAGRIGGDVKAV